MPPKKERNKIKITVFTSSKKLDFVIEKGFSNKRKKQRKEKIFPNPTKIPIFVTSHLDLICLYERIAINVPVKAKGKKKEKWLKSKLEKREKIIPKPTEIIEEENNLNKKAPNENGMARYQKFTSLKGSLEKEPARASKKYFIK